MSPLMPSVANDAKRFAPLCAGFVTFSHEALPAFAYYHQLGTTVIDKDPDPETHDFHGIDLDAWMASIKAQYRFSKQLEVQTGYDYLSGDDYIYVRPKGMMGTALHKTINYFKPVYGSNHKFYGMMDFFFLQAFSDSFSPGLQNLYAGVSYSPLKPLNLKATYHYLATTTDLAGTSKTLGHDIEFEASYQVLKDARISLGFSYMKGTETMERLKRTEKGNDLKWAWCSLTVSPRIISKKW